MQGSTVNKLVIDLGSSEKCAGLTYVAISRVRNIEHMLIEPMYYDRISTIKLSEKLQLRIREERRLREIIETTLTNYNFFFLEILTISRSVTT